MTSSMSFPPISTSKTESVTSLASRQKLRDLLHMWARMRRQQISPIENFFHFHLSASISGLLLPHAENWHKFHPSPPRLSKNSKEVETFSVESSRNFPVSSSWSSVSLQLAARGVNSLSPRTKSHGLVLWRQVRSDQIINCKLKTHQTKHFSQDSGEKLQRATSHPTSGSCFNLHEQAHHTSTTTSQAASLKSAKIETFTAPFTSLSVLPSWTPQLLAHSDPSTRYTKRWKPRHANHHPGRSDATLRVASNQGS